MKKAEDNKLVIRTESLIINVIDYNKLNKYLSNSKIISELRYQFLQLLQLKNSSFSFSNFIDKFIESLHDYKNNKDKSSLESTFGSLVKEWPLHLFLNNENKDKVPLDKFLFFSDNLFKLIDREYFKEFINESFKGLDKDQYKVDQLAYLCGRADKNNYNQYDLIIKIIEDNKIINSRISKETLTEYYVQCANAKIYKFRQHKSYEIKNLLDKGMRYINESTKSNLVEKYISSYLCLEVILNTHSDHKKMLYANEIQSLMLLLPDNDNKKYLQIQVKYKFLDTYDIKKFNSIDESKISQKYKDQYQKISFTIKYFNASIIDEEEFKKDYANITPIPRDKHKLSIIQEIITLKINKGYLKNLCFFLDQLDNKRFFSSKIYYKKTGFLFLKNEEINQKLKSVRTSKELNNLASLKEQKKNYISKLENIINKYGHDNAKEICEFIQKGYSLDQIKIHLEKLNEYISNNNHTFPISQDSESKSLEETKKCKNVKAKTKGVADPSKVEKAEDIKDEHIEASWMIGDKTITVSDQEVIKTKNENYYIYIGNNVNVSKKNLKQFKKAAENGFITADSYGKNGLKKIGNELIELKIKDNLRCFAKTIYINEQNKKLIIFSDAPKNHNKAETYIKNVGNKSEITKIYVYSASFEINESELVDTEASTNFSSNLEDTKLNLDYEYPISGEATDYNAVI